MRVQAEFNAAYHDVVLDEYCMDRNDHDEEIEDFMREVLIVGMGHSLGAQLQAVSCSDPRISKQCLSMGKRDQLIWSGWDGMVYLGFVNRQGRGGRRGDKGRGGGNKERTALAMAASGGVMTSGTTEQPVAGGDEMIATTTTTTMVRGADTVNTTAVAMPRRI